MQTHTAATLALGGLKPRSSLILSPGTRPRYSVSPKSQGVTKAEQSVRGALKTLRSGRRGLTRKRVSPLTKFVNRAVREALDQQMAVMSIKSPERPEEDSTENNKTATEVQDTTRQHEEQVTNPPAAPTRTSTRNRRPTPKAEEEATTGKRKRGRPKKK